MKKILLREKLVGSYTYTRNTVAKASKAPVKRAMIRPLCLGNALANEKLETKAKVSPNAKEIFP